MRMAQDGVPPFLKKAFLFLGIPALAYYVGTAVVTQPKNIKLIVLAPVVMYLLASRIEALMYIGLLIIFNGFGLFRVSFTVAGVFKTYDLGFMLSAISGGLVYLRRYRYVPGIYRSRIAMATLVFIGYVFIEILLTSVATGQSFVRSLQMGRHFFPLLLYFAAVPVLLRSNGWRRSVKWIVGISVAGAFFYAVNFNPFAAAAKTYSNVIAGQEVERRYSSFIYGPIFIVAGGLFAYLITDRIKRWRLAYWSMLAVISLQPILSFGRGYIIAFFTQLIVVLINAPVGRIKKNKITLIASISLMLALGVTSLIQYADTDRLMQLFIARMDSARTDFFEKTGTYEIRHRINAERMELVKENPVFGVGLIHPDAGLYPELDGIITTGHSGYISLLAPLGVLGFTLFVLYTGILYSTAVKVIRMDVPFFYRAIGMVTTGYVVQGYPRMLSTSSFTSFRSLAQMAVLAAILQVCIYRKRHGLFPDDAGREG